MRFDPIQRRKKKKKKKKSSSKIAVELVSAT